MDNSDKTIKTAVPDVVTLEEDIKPTTSSDVTSQLEDSDSSEVVFSQPAPYPPKGKRFEKSTEPITPKKLQTPKEKFKTPEKIPAPPPSRSNDFKKPEFPPVTNDFKRPPIFGMEHPIVPDNVASANTKEKSDNSDEKERNKFALENVSTDDPPGTQDQGENHILDMTMDSDNQLDSKRDDSPSYNKPVLSQESTVKVKEDVKLMTRKQELKHSSKETIRSSLESELPTETKPSPADYSEDVKINIDDYVKVKIEEKEDPDPSTEMNVATVAPKCPASGNFHTGKDASGKIKVGRDAGQKNGKPSSDSFATPVAPVSDHLSSTCGEVFPDRDKPTRHASMHRG